VHRAAGPIALVAAALCASGCSVFGSSKETLPALPALQQTTPARVVSHVGVGKSAVPGQAGPTVDDDRYYVVGEPGELAAFDTATGRPLWRVDTKERLSAGVGAADGLVAVGTRKGDLLAFDRDGKARWRAALGSDVAVAPAVGQGAVVVRTGDGHIVGLSASDGSRKWAFARNTPVLVLHASGAPAISDKVAYVPFPGGKLLAVEVDSGKVLWEATVAVPKGSTELERIADITGFPAIDPRQVCAATFQGRVACFDTASGSGIWAHDASVPHGQSADSARLVVSDERGRLLAYRRSDGAPLWTQDKLQGRHLSGPAVTERSIVVGDIEGYVHFIDPESGELTGRVATDGSAVMGQVASLGKGAVVSTAKGGVYQVAAP